MKTILNYGITYNEGNTKHDIQMFTKQTLIFEYLKILNSPDKDISSLTCYQWEGKKNPTYKDITGSINDFLRR